MLGPELDELANAQTMHCLSMYVHFTWGAQNGRGWGCTEREGVGVHRTGGGWGAQNGRGLGASLLLTTHVIS